MLDDEHAARAEALILPELAGKTAWMAGKLAAQAAATVDPEGSIKRRERAEREEARVRFWRENNGACALAAYALPTDAALAANANIAARARQYKKAKVDPGATMDRLRVLAFLDILNGIRAEARIASARAAQASAPAPTQADAQAGTGAGRPGDDRRGDNNDPRDEYPAADDDWPTDDDRPTMTRQAMMTRPPMTTGLPMTTGPLTTTGPPMRTGQQMRTVLRMTTVRR